MKVFFSIIGLFIFYIVWYSISHPAAGVYSSYHDIVTQAQSSSRSCDNATDHAVQAKKDYEAGSYKDAIQNGTHGVDIADNCGIPYVQEFSKGISLYYVSRSKFKTSDSSWKTDMNEAQEHFTQCAINYTVSAHERAACSTWQGNAISASVNLSVQAGD